MATRTPKTRRSTGATATQPSRGRARRTAPSAEPSPTPSATARPRGQKARDGAHGLFAVEGAAPEISSVATAAAVGVGAALIEAELLPGIVIGAAAVLLGRYFPQLGEAMRPMVKSAIRVGYSMAGTLRSATAEAVEQVRDLAAEVRAEGPAGETGHAAKSGTSGETPAARRRAVAGASRRARGFAAAPAKAAG